MAESKRIGAKIVIDGEKEYRQALNNAKAATTEFKSELAKLSTEFKGNEKTVEALTRKQEAYRKEQASLEKATKTIANRIEEANSVRKKEADSLEKSKKELSELNTALEKAKDEYGENSDEVKRLSEQIAVSEKEIKAQESALVKIDTQILKYNTELNQTETELIKVTRELDDTEAELRNATKGFSAGEKVVGAFKEATAGAGEKLKGLSDGFKDFVAMTAANLATDAIRGIVNGLKEMSTSAIRTGAEFETAMSTVSATMALTGTEIATASGRYKILEDSAREMGAATKYSAAEAAEALNYLALAGYEAEEAAKALPTVLNLAAAGAMDLGYASDLVTDSMSALGISMERLESFTDQMATTAQKSNTNIAQLGEAILVVGGTAKQLAGGTVELNTALGILADNGIKGAEGGTALRNVLKNLLTPTDTAQKTFQRLNFSAYDLYGNIKPLNVTLQELSRKLEGLSDRERNETLNGIFDTRTLKSAEALLANCGERFSELSGYISDCDGAAAMMAYTMSNNLEGKVKQLNSAAQELGISIYQKIETPLKNAVGAGVDGINTLSDAVNHGKLGQSLDNLGESIEDLAERGIEIATDMLPRMIDGASWLIDNLDGIVVGVKALITAYVSYEATTKAVTIATELFGVALNATPIGLAAAAVAGLVTVMVGLNNATKGAASEAEKQAETLAAVQTTMLATVASGAELVTEYENQKKYTEELIRELDVLNSKEELNANEKKRVKEIIGILNNTYPGLSFAIDETTGKTVENTEAIRKNVEQLEKQIAAQAMQEKLSEIYAENADAAYELWKAEQELSGVEDELTVVRQQLAEETEKTRQLSGEAAGSFGMESAAAQELILKEEELQKQKAALTLTIGEYNESTAQATAETDELRRYMEEELGVSYAAAEALDQTAAATDHLEGSAGELSETTNEVTEALAQMAGELQETVQDALESTNDVFNEFKGAETQNINEMRTNINDHIQGVNEWKDSYITLAERVGTSATDVLMYLADMGVEGKGYIDEMLTLSDDELTKFVDQMQEALTLPAAVSDEIVSSYLLIGETVVDTITGTVRDGAAAGGEIDTATRAVGATITEAMEDELKISGSESQVMSDTGKTVTVSLATGIEEEKGEVTRATTEVTEEIGTVTGKELEASKFIATGEQIPAGLAQGIRNGQSEVVNATRDICTAAVEAANQTLKINSPSKVFEQIGKYSGEGYIAGWDSKSDAMVNAVHQTMRNVAGTGAEQSAGPVGSLDTSEIVGILQQYLPYLARTISLNQFAKAIAPQMDWEIGREAARGSAR